MRNYPLKGKAGPLLIAEIGGNHEGNFAYAQELTRLALKSGADSVKFQLYQGETLVSAVESPQRHKHFQKFELTREQHIELAQMVIDGGADYLASVWDLEMLEWIDPFLNYYKIGSGDLTAWPILAEFARRGKPMILSTGLATFEEVATTVDFIRQTNPIYQKRENLAVLQCTSMYPIERKDANLAVMNRYRETFNCLVGYSDHTQDALAMEIATALGADALEFHFTDTRDGKEFRDHKVSLTWDEVVSLRERIQEIQEVIGSQEKRPMACEIETDHVNSFRRATYFNRDLPAGHLISENDFIHLRPNNGIDPREAQNLIGKTLTQKVTRGKAIDATFLS